MAIKRTNNRFCIFDAIYGIVDISWISQISVHASFAVGVSIPFVSLIFSFGDSIGQGANSLMSRFMRIDDYESAYNTLIHGIILTNIIWIFIVICALFAQGIIQCRPGRLIYFNLGLCESLVKDVLLR